MRRDAIGHSAILIVVAATVAGCGSGSSPGLGVRTVSWSRSSAGNESVPGIDSASVRFGVYGSGFALVAWSDARGGNFNASWDNLRQAVHYEGNFKAEDGRSIDFECFTSDGQSGTVTIDGKQFELPAGGLFLIATRGPETVVRQLERDLSSFRPDSGSLQALATSDAEIQGFFEAERAGEAL